MKLSPQQKRYISFAGDALRVSIQFGFVPLVLYLGKIAAIVSMFFGLMTHCVMVHSPFHSVQDCKPVLLFLGFKQGTEGKEPLSWLK